MGEDKLMEEASNVFEYGSRVFCDSMKFYVEEGIMDTTIISLSQFLFE